MAGDQQVMPAESEAESGTFFFFTHIQYAIVCEPSEWISHCVCPLQSIKLCVIVRTLRTSGETKCASAEHLGMCITNARGCAGVSTEKHLVAWYCNNVIFFPCTAYCLYFD